MTSCNLRPPDLNIKNYLRWGAYLYSTTPQKSVSKEARIAPLAGYGYGIPLSIVYARYLGGEVDIQTIQGYGEGFNIYFKFKEFEFKKKHKEHIFKNL